MCTVLADSDVLMLMKHFPTSAWLNWQKFQVKFSCHHCCVRQDLPIVLLGSYLPGKPGTFFFRDFFAILSHTVNPHPL
jgi:hypothetical protein